MERERHFQLVGRRPDLTTPVRPPSDIRWQCQADDSEFNTFTGAWNHMLDEHASISPDWLLLGTLPE